MQKRFLVSLFFISISACSPRTEEPSFLSITETRGDTLIVANSGLLVDHTVLTLKHEQVIGDPEDDPSKTYVRLHSASIDEDGFVYVLDRESSGPGNATRVIVFRPNGRHLRTWGVEGRGPTDLGLTVSIVTLPSGNVAVGGFHLTRIFNSDGQLQRDWRTLASESDGGWIPKGGPREVLYIENHDMTFIRSWRNPLPSSPRCSYAIALLNPGGNLFKLLCDLEIEEAAFGTGAYGLVMPWLPELVGTATQSGKVCWGITDTREYYQLDLQSGQYMRVIFNIPPTPLLQSEIDAVVQRKAMMPDGKVDEGFFRWARGLSYPKFKPFYDGMYADDSGRVWLRESLGGWTESRHRRVGQFVLYHIFSPDGVYQGTARAPVSIIHISETHLFSIENEPEYGSPQINLYRLVENK